MEKENLQKPNVKIQMNLEQNRLFQECFLQQKRLESNSFGCIDNFNNTDEIFNNDFDLVSTKYPIAEQWSDKFDHNKSQIQKFIERLKNNASNRNIQLPKEQRLLLDENYETDKIKNSFFKSKMIIWFFSHIKMIHPLSNFKMMWDMLHFINLSFMFFFIPIDISFYKEVPLSFSNTLYFILFIFYITDILININTGFYNKGEVIFDHYEIFHNFFKNYFLIDFCGTLPYFYSLIIYNENNAVDDFVALKILYFLKIPRFLQLYDKILERFKLKKKLKGYICLFNIVFFLLFVSHIIACVWHFIGFRLMEKSLKNWIEKAGLENTFHLYYYLYSYYWTIVTIITVGYGDITPSHEIEFMFSTIVIFFGCGMFAYIINIVGLTLQEISRENIKFNNSIKIINDFMDRKKIGNFLQMRIREYLKYIWEEEKISNIEEELKIMNLLSKSLKEELQLEAYGRVFKKFPLFFCNFSEKTLNKFAGLMKEVRFTPKENIFEVRKKFSWILNFI